MLVLPATWRAEARTVLGFGTAGANERMSNRMALFKTHRCSVLAWMQTLFSFMSSLMPNDKIPLAGCAFLALPLRVGTLRLRSSMNSKRRSLPNVPASLLQQPQQPKRPQKRRPKRALLLLPLITPGFPRMASFHTPRPSGMRRPTVCCGARSQSLHRGTAGILRLLPTPAGGGVMEGRRMHCCSFCG